MTWRVITGDADVRFEAGAYQRLLVAREVVKR